MMVGRIFSSTLLLAVGFAVADLEIFRNRALTGHKLDTHVVEDELDCGRRCLACDGCISYNYQYKVNHRKVHKCELNSQTKEAKPEDYEVKYGFQYFGSVNEQEKGVGCVKYACYNGGRCVDTCHGDMFYCHCTKMFRGKQCERPRARSCKELLELGDTSDGAKRVAPDDDGYGISVYCDQTTDGGGWTLIQKRTTPFDTHFSKNWAEYEAGFGHLFGSFYWIGNSYLSRLTTTPVQLRIELQESGGNRGYTVYENFSISGNEDNYRLSIGRYAAGDIGNAIHGDTSPAFIEDGMQFTTADRDNDANNLGNCAKVGGASGWWLSNCGRANLNKAHMPQWDEWIYLGTINYTEMKIRPYN